MTSLSGTSHFKVGDTRRLSKWPALCEPEHIRGCVRMAATVFVFGWCSGSGAHNANLSPGSSPHPAGRKLRQGLCLGWAKGEVGVWGLPPAEGGNYAPGGWPLLAEYKKKSKGKVNVGGKLYYFKGQAGQLGRGWVIGEKAVGKNNSDWIFHLKYHSVSWKSSVCLWHDGRHNLGVTYLKYLSINITKFREQQGPIHLSSPIAHVMPETD